MKTIDMENYKRILREIIEEVNSDELFSIPGIFGILADFYYDEIMEKWRKENTTIEEQVKEEYGYYNEKREANHE